MINLVAVVAIAMKFGIGPSLTTAAASAIGFDFFFIPPRFAFAPEDLKSAITLIVMVAVAAVISGLGEQTRRQHGAAKKRELQMETERLRSSLLSAVSHDLRTPLAAILGAGTELLEEGRKLSESEHDGLVESIVEEAERLDELVTNLLDVARLDGGAVVVRKRAEPLDEVVEAALSRLQGRLGDRAVRSRIPEEIPMVPMEAVLVQHVLVNLLENALRHAPGDSPIEIEASATTGLVTVEVRDRGPGIGTDDADHLFDRFQRGTLANRRDGGMGLGLTICREIVRAHGGRISIENREGGGAVVRFVLPLDAEPGRP